MAVMLKYKLNTYKHVERRRFELLPSSVRGSKLAFVQWISSLRIEAQWACQSSVSGPAPCSLRLVVARRFRDTSAE